MATLEKTGRRDVDFGKESSTQNTCARVSYMLPGIWLTLFESSTREYLKFDMRYPGRLSTVIVVLVHVCRNPKIAMSQKIVVNDQNASKCNGHRDVACPQLLCIP